MESVTTKLRRITEQAKSSKEFVFTNLMHLVDVNFLCEANRLVRKDGAVGIDGQSGEDYNANLMENIRALHKRMKSGQYRAPEIKRVWIPKGDGKERPIGITTYEDKIVQRAVTMLLSAIYEVDFVDESHGFRPGRGAHGAIHAIRENCIKCDCRMIIDADIQGYFDDINHQNLIKILKKRVKDGSLIKFIIGWLKTGIIDKVGLLKPEKGSPQGGIISPILANIYLHEVLDSWFKDDVMSVMRGKCFLIRYADDFILGFSNENDAHRVMKVLPKRFGKYGLTIHPDKSKLLKFWKPIGAKNKSDSFDFLGFTHYWSRSMKGNWIIKRRSSRKKLNAKLTALKDWCKENMHRDIKKQWIDLVAKLKGHYGYYGIRGNYKQLEVYYEYAIQVWRRSLNRRNSKGNKSHERFKELILSKYPLPKPRIQINC